MKTMLKLRFRTRSMILCHEMLKLETPQKSSARFLATASPLSTFQEKIMQRAMKSVVNELTETATFKAPSLDTQSLVETDEQPTMQTQLQHAMKGENSDSVARSELDIGDRHFEMLEPLSPFIFRRNKETHGSWSTIYEVVSNTTIEEVLEAETEVQTMDVNRKSFVSKIRAGSRSLAQTDPFEVIGQDLKNMNSNIKELLGSDHPVLQTVAQYFFNHDKGKKLRPSLVLLFAKAFPPIVAAANVERAVASVTAKQRRLAEISELIHTASLLHDDVVDNAETRRGLKSVNQQFGNKVAILAGDFLLARASIHLSRLRHLDVVEVMSTVVEHLVKGEMLQIKTSTSLETPTKELDRFELYLTKNYCKTGSLFANSILSSVLLSNQPRIVQELAFEYGDAIGQCFQLTDDCLDFEGSFDLGKPLLNDLKQGLATAPVLLARVKYPELEEVIARKFEHTGDVELAIDRIMKADTVMLTRRIAKLYAIQALKAAKKLRRLAVPLDSAECNETDEQSRQKAFDSLIHLPSLILDRKH